MVGSISKGTTLYKIIAAVVKSRALLTVLEYIRSNCLPHAESGLVSFFNLFL